MDFADLGKPRVRTEKYEKTGCKCSLFFASVVLTVDIFGDFEELFGRYIVS